VADRLLNVACAMLRHGTLFNPEAAQTLPSTTKFKIDTVTQNRLAKRWGVPSKTATFETRSIPPAFVRRISYPTAARYTVGSWSAGKTRAYRVLVTWHPLRVRRGAWPVTARYDQRKPISLKHRSFIYGLKWWNTP